MQAHRTYFDPPRTSSVRKVQWIAPRREGHREFLDVSPNNPNPGKPDDR